MRLVLLVMMMVFGVLAKAETLMDCDALYAARGTGLLSSSQCYIRLHSSNQISSTVFYERVFTSLSQVVNDFSAKTEERTAIDQALTLLPDLKKNSGDEAYSKYWEAVWISFDAVQKDRGSVLPTTMFGRISTIQNLLTAAIQSHPQIHFYGPHRVLGLMHTQMPKIAGGDKKYAEQLLAEAYKQQPQYFSNVYNYANILFINGKNAAAKTVVEQFLATDDSFYEVYAPENLRSLKPEITAEKAKAQKLLQEIISEE